MPDCEPLASPSPSPSSSLSTPSAPLPAIVARMQMLVDSWYRTPDTRVIFLNCYLLMTRNMLAAIDAGEFRDPMWVRFLLHRFAEYYFEALDAFAHDPNTTPHVWRVTHQAAARTDMLVLQNLMLGVNAHINYDLVLTLVEVLEDEWPHLSLAQRQARYADHSHVNQVIARTIDTVQDEVICRLSPAFFLVDKICGPVDEWMTGHMIATWRDSVWDHAVRMLACKASDERECLRVEVEEITLRRADAILLSNNLAALRVLF